MALSTPLGVFHGSYGLPGPKDLCVDVAKLPSNTYKACDQVVAMWKKQSPQPNLLYLDFVDATVPFLDVIDIGPLLQGVSGSLMLVYSAPILLYRCNAIVRNWMETDPFNSNWINAYCKDGTAAFVD